MNTAFAEELKRIRIAANLSQAEVAKDLGYSSPQFVSNWERGLSFPPPGKLKRFARRCKADYGPLRVRLIEDKTNDFRSRLEKRVK